MRRIQVLDHDESHAAVGGQRIHKPAARIQAARGRTYADDKKIVRFSRRGRNPRRAYRLHCFSLWGGCAPAGRLRSGNPITNLVLR
jgi:predicted pyridoxine 5'-phosphate oxidase superfamily flavin-nucleotide-binding protein